MSSRGHQTGAHVEVARLMRLATGPHINDEVE